MKTQSRTVVSVLLLGSEEALVVASTCFTGTAGPDVHAVFRLDKSGQPQELPRLS